MNPDASGGDTHRSRFSYPVFADLHEVPVLVVGGGRTGARKAAGLVAAGAVVTMVAAKISDHVDRSALAEARERVFRPDDLDGMRLVITATGDVDTDTAVSAAARSRAIWTNAADQPVDCQFILPAIARTGRVMVAVGTDGASPALARELRNVIAELLTPEIAALAEELAAQRQAIKARGGSTEHVDWTAQVRAGIASATQGRGRVTTDTAARHPSRR